MSPELISHGRVIVGIGEEHGKIKARLLPVDNATDLIVVNQDIRVLEIPMDDIMALEFCEKVCGTTCVVLEGGVQTIAVASVKNSLDGPRSPDLAGSRCV
jgi:hypothetical protein